jgi:hypothetical protein
LYGPDIIPCFKQMGRKTVAKSMTTRRLGEPGLPDSRLYCPLQDQFVNVMAPDDACPWIARRLCSRENILPHPLVTGIGVFAL